VLENDEGELNLLDALALRLVSDLFLRKIESFRDDLLVSFLEPLHLQLQAFDLTLYFLGFKIVELALKHLLVHNVDLPLQRLHSEEYLCGMLIDGAEGDVKYLQLVVSYPSGL